jgi:hypothetical protein
MSKQDDLKFLHDEVLGKQNNVEFTTDYNAVSRMANRTFLFVALGKDSIKSGNPSNDEIGLYAKLDNRTYKVSLSEVS